MRRDYPCLRSSPSFSILLLPILFSPFSYTLPSLFLSPLNQEGVRFSFSFSRSLGSRCCTEQMLRPLRNTHPLSPPWRERDAAPRRSRDLAQRPVTSALSSVHMHHRHSTRSSLSLSRARARARTREYARRGTFSPYVSLPRRCSHIFLYEFPFGLPESSPLVLPSFLECSCSAHVHVFLRARTYVPRIKVHASPPWHRLLCRFFLSSSSFFSSPFFFLFLTRQPPFHVCSSRIHGQKTRRLYWRQFAPVPPF